MISIDLTSQYCSRINQLEAYYGVNIGYFWRDERFDESRRAFLKDKVAALISFDRGVIRNASAKVVPDA